MHAARIADSSIYHRAGNTCAIKRYKFAEQASSSLKSTLQAALAGEHQVSYRGLTADERSGSPQNQARSRTAQPALWRADTSLASSISHSKMMRVRSAVHPLTACPTLPPHRCSLHPRAKRLMRACLFDSSAHRAKNYVKFMRRDI